MRQPDKKKPAGNHYEIGKLGIARAAKKTVEILRDDTLALGSGKEENKNTKYTK